MNVVDSSGWLEYFAQATNDDCFAPAIETPQLLIVPTISMYEVFKRVHLQMGVGDALKIVAKMAQGKVVELTQPLALQAAKLSMAHKLPMTDSTMVSSHIMDAR